MYDMEEINDQFAEADVAVVIGANDVVNPAAKTDPASPIYGMPILRVNEAKAVIVLKRSMNTGFAGVENDLFFDERTSIAIKQCLLYPVPIDFGRSHPCGNKILRRNAGENRHGHVRIFTIPSLAYEFKKELPLVWLLL